MSDKTMWAVSRGDYSDYRVLCVCPNKKTATKVAAHVNSQENVWDKAQVESIPFITEPQRVTIYWLDCEVWDNGTTSATRENVRTESNADMLYPEHNVPVFKRWVRAPTHGGKGGRLGVRGTDLQRVRQTFSDMRAQLLADDVLRAKREIRS